MRLLRLLETQLKKKAVGTLTLGKGRGFREVFFEQDSLYLVGQVFSGKIATDKLFELGIPGQRISLNKFETIISGADLKQILFPEVLRDQGVVKADELRALVDAQLTEEIVDLLFRNSDSFHFQEDRVPEYLLKCEEITSRVPVSLGVIFERLQQHAELMPGYEAVVPSQEEIFVATEKGLAVRQENKTDYRLQRILCLVDGFRNLGSIIADMYLFEFEVLSWVVKALENGYIKKTVLPELKGLVTQNMTAEDAARYLPYLKNALKYGANELGARERLAVVYEKTGKIEDAVIQYNFIGDALHQMRKPSKAVKAYQKALALKPGEILITDKVANIYREAAEEELSSGDIAQAVQFLESALKMRPDDQEVFAQLVDLLIREERLPEVSNVCDWMTAYSRKTRSAEVGINACKFIIGKLPGNIAFRKKLINLYLDFQLMAEACSEMQSLVLYHIEKSERDKAAELIDKMRRMGMQGEDTSQLERQIEQMESHHPRRPFRKRTIKYAIMAFTFLFCVYQLLGYVAWNRIRQYQALATTEPLDGARTVRVLPGPEESHLLSVLTQCESFLRKFPCSFFRPQVEGLHSRTQRRVEDLERARTATRQKILDGARAAVAEGEKVQAEQLVSPFLKLPPSDSFRVEAENLLKEVHRHGHTASSLFEKAKALEERRDWRGAFGLYTQLMKSFPNSTLIKDIQLPILIESVPPGVQVRQVDGPKAGEPQGTTPVPVFLPPQGTAEITLSTPGYASLTAEVSELDGADRVFLLSREPDWSLSLDGIVEHGPSVWGDLVLCGTGQGTLLCLDAAARNKLWSLTGASLQTMVAPPLVTEDGVLTVWNNGKLIFFRGLSSSAIDRHPPPPPPVAADLFLGSLATSQLHQVGETSLVVIGTKSGKLQAYDKHTAASVWSLPVSALAVSFADAPEGDLLVGTAEGTVLRVNLREPKVLWTRHVSAEGPVEVASSSNAVAAKTAKNELVFLRPGDGGIAEKQQLPPDSLVCVVPSDGRLFVLGRDGNLQSLSVETGEPTLRRSLPIVPTDLTFCSGFLCVRTDDGKALLVIDAKTLQPLWATQLGAKITAVGASRAWIAVATEKQRLVLFRLRDDPSG